MEDHFVRERAWPILDGTAEWIVSRVRKTRRGYEILHTTGPTEDKGPVDNNAYVNMTAVVVLRAAAACAQRQGYTSPAEWGRIADHLVIPHDPKTGVISTYDGYTPDEPGGGTPSAASAFFPMSYRADPDVERATLRFYVDLADTYIGAPMLSAMYGVYAARLGDRALSARLFDQGYAAFVQQPFNVPGETPKGKPPRAGPFFANAGSFLMGCLFGLPGLTLGSGDPHTWCERPVVLPAGWDAIEVERIWVRGQPARLLARHGDERARIEIAEDDC